VAGAKEVASWVVAAPAVEESAAAAPGEVASVAEVQGEEDLAEEVMGKAEAGTEVAAMVAVGAMDEAAAGEAMEVAARGVAAGLWAAQAAVARKWPSHQRRACCVRQAL